MTIIKDFPVKHNNLAGEGAFRKFPRQLKAVVNRTIGVSRENREVSWSGDVDKTRRRYYNFSIIL